jgi:predicted NUDIX family NTP pyrophosphohydrolase
MGAKRSAGILLYRYHAGELQVLLGHPGGPYWEHKPDDGTWSIPKGEPMADETDLALIARREFAEETGTQVIGPLRDLGSVVSRSGKQIFAWAAQGDLDPASAHSNLFSLEWPPASGVIGRFPEIDRVVWFNLEAARRKLRSPQDLFLERLTQALRRP